METAPKQRPDIEASFSFITQRNCTVNPYFRKIYLTFCKLRFSLFFSRLLRFSNFRFFLFGDTK